MSESRGCLSCKASKGEAVVGYRESLATQQMGYHRLVRLWRAFPPGKQNGDFFSFYISPTVEL